MHPSSPEWLWSRLCALIHNTRSSHIHSPPKPGSNGRFKSRDRKKNQIAQGLYENGNVCGRESQFPQDIRTRRTNDFPRVPPPAGGFCKKSHVLLIGYHCCCEADVNQYSSCRDIKESRCRCENLTLHVLVHLFIC